MITIALLFLQNRRANKLYIKNRKLTDKISNRIKPSDQTSTLGLDGGKVDNSVSSSIWTGPQLNTSGLV